MVSLVFSFVALLQLQNFTETIEIIVELEISVMAKLWSQHAHFISRGDPFDDEQLNICK